MKLFFRAYSVVSMNIPSSSIAYGVPAKISKII